MSEAVTLQRLRGFLRGLSVALLLGAVVELILAKHTDGLVQWIPSALCGLGLLAVLVAWLRPSRLTVLVLRGVMVVVASGSLLGMYEHYEGNLGFAQETHPKASARDLLKPSLMGRDPLLAPGILAVAAANTAGNRERKAGMDEPGVLTGRAG